MPNHSLNPDASPATLRAVRSAPANLRDPVMHCQVGRSLPPHGRVSVQSFGAAQAKGRMS